MNRCVGICLLVLFLCFSHGLAGDELPPQQVQEEVIVQGYPEKILSNFVKQLASAGPTDQISRWKGRFCLVVLGLSPAATGYMVERIDELAAAVKLKHAPEGCAPSMTVLFARDADTVASELATQYFKQLRADGTWRLQLFVESDEPVRWLSVTNHCGFGCAMANSRIRKDTGPSLAGMLVLVDADQVSGYSLGEVSDFIALVVLSNPQADSRHSAQSILSMFDRSRKGNSTYELTEYDLAFLADLYKTDPHLRFTLQRKQIEHKMTQELGQDYSR